MTGYELEDEFILRTEKNLRTIENLHAQGENVYEVTQLINSLLGLLVFPREVFLNHIPRISRETMIRRGWPLPLEPVGQVRDLRELVIKLRNGIAHCNIKFMTSGKVIEGIEFKYYPMRAVDKTNPAWIGVYRVDQLRQFVNFLLTELARARKH